MIYNLLFSTKNADVFLSRFEFNAYELFSQKLIRGALVVSEKCYA